MTARVPGKMALLSTAAERVAADPSFMGWVIFSGRNGPFDLTEVASELDTDEASVIALALCKRPRTSLEHFVTDVRAIAAYSGIAEQRIAGMVRRVDAIAAMRKSGGTELMAAAQDVIDPLPAPPSSKS